MKNYSITSRYKSSSRDSLLNYFDFVCISLETRIDRRIKMIEVFNQLGILDRMGWWVVSKHPQGGMFGCFESHWSIWTSNEFTKKFICIFEDDQHLLDNSIERFYLALKYAKKYCGKKFDLLNLEPGFSFSHDETIPLSEGLNDQVLLGHAHHLGCYISTKNFLMTISEDIKLWYGVDIDTALYKSCKMAYVKDKIFMQDPKDSDNGGGYREKIGIKTSPEFSRSWNEFRKIIPIVNCFILEMTHLFSWYFLMRSTEIPELKDRRIKLKLT